jgi:hypothetical protein
MRDMFMTHDTICLITHQERERTRERENERERERERERGRERARARESSRGRERDRALARQRERESFTRNDTGTWMQDIPTRYHHLNISDTVNPSACVLFHVQT